MEHTTFLKVVMVSLVALAGAIAASMIVATGGAALIGAAAAVGLTGYAYYSGKEDMDTTDQPAQPSLPTRNNSLPSYNNNQGGYNNNNNQNTGTSQTIQTTAIFKLNDRDFATAIATSNHTSGK